MDMILSLTTQKLKQISMSEKDNMLVYIITRIIFLAVMLLADFAILYFMGSYLDIQIKRGLMLTFVTLSEIGIILFTNNRYLKKDVLRKHLERNEYQEYYSDLLVFGYKNASMTFYFVIPFLIAYGTIRDAEILFYINTIISLLVLPMISVIISMVLPDDVSASTSKFVKMIHKTFISMITFLIYVIFCLLLKDVFASYYPSNFFSLEFIEHMLNIPITIDGMIFNPIMEMFSVSTGIISRNFFEITVIVATFTLIIKITGVIHKINKNVSSESINSQNVYRLIKNNNTKVCRINFNIMYCMPRSPDYY